MCDEEKTPPLNKVELVVLDELVKEIESEDCPCQRDCGARHLARRRK